MNSSPIIASSFTTHYMLTRASILQICRDTFGMEVIPEHVHEGHCPQCSIPMRTGEIYCPEGCFRLGHASNMNSTNLSAPPLMYNLTAPDIILGRARSYHCATCNRQLRGYQCPANTTPYQNRPNFHSPLASSPDVVRCNQCTYPYHYGNCPTAQQNRALPENSVVGSHNITTSQRVHAVMIPALPLSHYCTETYANLNVIQSDGDANSFDYISPLSDHYSGVRIEVLLNSTTRSRVLFSYNRDAHIPSASVKHAIIRYLLTLRNALVLAITGGFVVYHSLPLRIVYTREPDLNRQNIERPLDLRRNRNSERSVTEVRPHRINNSNNEGMQFRERTTGTIPRFNFVPAGENDQFQSYINDDESLQPRTFPTNEQLIEASPCAICHEELCEGESIVRLPRCGHIFHYLGCLRIWIGYSRQCPICRQNINIEDLCNA